MKARYAAVLAALTALGCAAGPSPAHTPSPAGTPSLAGTWPPDQAAYLQSLARIDETLAGDPYRAIRHARQTCADIRGGLSGRALRDRVAARLSRGGATLGAEQADAAVALMRQRIC